MLCWLLLSHCHHNKCSYWGVRIFPNHPPIRRASAACSVVLLLWWWWWRCFTCQGKSCSQHLIEKQRQRSGVKPLAVDGERAFAANEATNRLHLPHCCSLQLLSSKGSVFASKAKQKERLQSIQRRWFSLVFVVFSVVLFGCETMVSLKCWTLLRSRCSRSLLACS